MKKLKSTNNVPTKTFKNKDLKIIDYKHYTLDDIRKGLPEKHLNELQRKHDKWVMS